MKIANYFEYLLQYTALMDLSWIQRHVLLVLMRQRTARLKDMRPLDVEANLFSYHLKGLEHTGYIEKIARGEYELTVKGQKFVGALSTQTNQLTENIKTVVLFWAEKDGKILLFRWSRQPYLNSVTLPYDRMPLGKSLSQGIADATSEKIGIEADKVSYVASALISIQRDNVIVSHMNALVFRVDPLYVHETMLSRNGEAFLADVTTVGLMDGVEEFLNSLRSGQRLIESVWRYTD